MKLSISLPNEIVSELDQRLVNKERQTGKSISVSAFIAAHLKRSFMNPMEVEV